MSFSVREGETLGLVGESGCGKSTIGRQIVGLERPTEGIIRYDGKDLSAMKPGELRQIRTQLQMVFQDPYSSLNPRKHIYEILAQPMLYHHIATKATVGKELERLLDMVGLSRNVLGRYPHEFSGGQRQRIGIARALSLNPRFLVCDEPVSALDVSIQAQILNLLKSLQKELNLTCIFVGHGLGAVNYVSDRIAVMYLGKIVEIGKAADVFPLPRPSLHKGADRGRAGAGSGEGGTGEKASGGRGGFQPGAALRLQISSQMSLRAGKLPADGAADARGEAGKRAFRGLPRRKRKGGQSAWVSISSNGS